jgi:hypothetical protein
MRPTLLSIIAAFALSLPSCVSTQGLTFSYDTTPLGIPGTVGYADGKAVVAVRVFPAK